MSDVDWEKEFRAVYDRAVKAYRAGAWNAESCVPDEDRRFLGTFGASAQEVFDFVEDWCQSDSPTFEEALEVVSIRRDYFLKEQGGHSSGTVRAMSEFPAKTDAVDGIAWLPRLIVKAHARLRGELPDQLMYGCGGDRPFLRGLGIGLGEFLRAVREAEGNDRKVVELVKRRRAGKP